MEADEVMTVKGYEYLAVGFSDYFFNLFTKDVDACGVFLFDDKSVKVMFILELVSEKKQVHGIVLVVLGRKVFKQVI